MNATYGSLPFAEAIKFLLGKIDMPTEKWTDVMGAAHNRGFMVAGAAKKDLLADLHAMINKGIAGETTLADFRKGFDVAVKKYGWAYKGQRGWRTATIFQTNLSVAYSAGREQQRHDPVIMQEFPYNRFRHMPGERSPRQEHLGWDNLILPATDPWWKTHSTPLGWGCQCWIEPMTAAQAEAIGISQQAPNNGTYEWQNPSTGKTEIVPNGIDPGWNYYKGENLMGEP